MNNLWIPNTKYLYQFGNANDKHLVINKEAFKSTNDSEMKTVFDDSSNLYHGTTRLNVGQKDFKKAYQWDVDFSIEKYTSFQANHLNDINLDVVSNALYDREKFMFFFTTDHNGDVTRVFYTLGVCIKLPNQLEEYRLNMTQAELLPSISFISYPFLYEADFDEIEIVDYAEYIANRPIYDGTYTYDGAITYGDSTGGIVSLSSLTQSALNDILLNWNPNYFLKLSDRFFDRSTSVVNDTHAIINQTLTNNLNTPLTTTTELQHTTAPNLIYLMELSTMQPNAWIEALNQSNNSGLRFTWLDLSNSPANMTYNSHWDELYDLSTNLKIEKSKYRIDQVSDEFLYFSPLAQAYALNDTTSEQMNLVKNSTNTVTIKIETLKSFH